MNNTKAFLKKCKRVWHTLKKPSKEEFWQTTKISAIGIVILGVIGFAISLAMNAFFK